MKHLCSALLVNIILFSTSYSLYINDSQGDLLIASAAHGNYENVSVIINENPSIVDYQEATSGKTALHYAAEMGFFRMAKLLLAANASPNIQSSDIYHPFPLHLATINGHRDIVHELLLANANPNAITMVSRQTSLHMAAKLGYEVIVSDLLTFHANKLLTDAYGKTALDYAQNNEWNRIIELLR